MGWRSDVDETGKRAGECLRSCRTEPGTERSDPRVEMRVIEDVLATEPLRYGRV